MYFDVLESNPWGQFLLKNKVILNTPRKTHGKRMEKEGEGGRLAK